MALNWHAISVAKVSQFKLTIVVAFALVGLMLSYLVYSSVSYQWQFIQQKSNVLQGFAERAYSRVMTNPQQYLGENATILGDDRMQFVSSYQELKTHLVDAPEREQIVAEQVNLILRRLGAVITAADIMLIYSFEHNQQEYFAYFHNNTDFNNLELNSYLHGRMQPALLVSIVIIAALFVFQFVQTYRVNKVVNALVDWADDMAHSKQFTAPPKVSAGGMNYLAHTLDQSLNTFSQILEQEHAFARFSSHELRTHVAVLSANMDILEFIMKDLKPAERKALNRMLLAVEDMKYQTDALLCLSKESELSSIEECELVSLIEKSLDENRIYHDKQNVVINKHWQKHEVAWQTEPMLLQIAINNLIRNALQNTQVGSIDIQVTEQLIVIHNKNNSADNDSRHDGFGIGLEIVKRVMERLKLNYQVEEYATGRKVTLSVT